ncbi:MAG: hypothetical protein LC732_07810, partial [Acidobacteria bacterium]|nr:hypothetical protein [Acidobacteriota bacterium]
MAEPTPSLENLRSRLEALLSSGMAEEPIEHATQVAEIAAILHSALSQDGFEVTLVGGSAIEVHAPGIYRSGDLDMSWLGPELEREDSTDALEALRQLAASQQRVTD